MQETRWFFFYLPPPPGRSQGRSFSSMNSLSNIEDCFILFTLKCQNNWCPNTSHTPRRERWVSYGGKDGVLNWPGRFISPPLTERLVNSDVAPRRAAGATARKPQTLIIVSCVAPEMNDDENKRDFLGCAMFCQTVFSSLAWHWIDGTADVF